jgi:fatty-acyl-CoA synthase
MFSRMLRLPKEERERHDLSCHELALHGAAPCPVHLKRQMIEWWGPILLEAYGCTELYGFTVITAAEWLEHPGSVGKSMLGRIHICDEAGVELPARSTGVIYFEGEQACGFQYNNDAEKTHASRHAVHSTWSTVGDLGYLDAEGYLYLTDRKDFMIISGGVNISPQAVEEALGTHPQVDDVAVFGVPNEEMGEEVKALVQLLDGAPGTEELARELLEYARQDGSLHGAALHRVRAGAAAVA